MRLRTFESFWLLKNGLLYTYPMLRHHATTEMLVVGGGITGALISHALVEAGYQTILIDKRDIALGSTSATTSMLQYEIDTPLYKLAAMIGEEEAATCYREGINAIDKLDELVRQYQVDCGFKNQNSLYIAHNSRGAKDLEKEYLARDAHQLGVSWLSAIDIQNNYGIRSKGGILSTCAGSVDAYQLAHELIAMNTQKGLQVYDQTCIKDYKFHRDGVQVVTDTGCKVDAKKIIFCTGYEATDMLKENIADLIYTWATISEEDIELASELKNTLVWDTQDPYLYMRSTDDGRLLIGGEDSPFNKLSLTNNLKEKKSKKLISSLHHLLGDVNFIEDHNWGGVFGKTKDGLPYIGASPEYEHTYFVLGFGGNGITFSIQAMDIIIDLLQNKPNELSHYYRFGR